MKQAKHLEFLVEEPSMEVFLQGVIPRLVPSDCTFEVHVFRGKPKLLRNLSGVLHSYRDWLPPDWRLVVMVDRDDDDCRDLKRRLKDAAHGLLARSQASDNSWQIVFRIVNLRRATSAIGPQCAMLAQECRPTYPKTPAFEIPTQFREELGRHSSAFCKGMVISGPGCAKSKPLERFPRDWIRTASRSFAAFRDAVMEAAT